MNENQDQLHASAKTAKMLCRCLAVMTLIGQLAQAASLGTGFTYQGRLFIGDVPANGLYDLQFTNYDAAAGGNALGAFNTNALPVTNGLFTVTLDFGAVFDGTPRWLEISERTNNVGAFGTLAPRQLLAAAPYATYAASAGAVPGLLSGSDDTENSFVGPNAGNLTMSGTENTANGCAALFDNTSGAENTANGCGALWSNTSGSDNTANGYDALIGNLDGNANTADGYNALSDNVSGSMNIALGYNAGHFITGNNNIDIGNQGFHGESGIIRIGDPTIQTATYLAGTVYANGVALTSDRNSKENFKPVNPQTVLAKVVALPVSQWNFKTDSQDVRHLGPMAQDFQASFGLDGADDKHISVVDEGGVALAAIQGLNQKLEETRADNADLRARLEKLERLVQSSK